MYIKYLAIGAVEGWKSSQGPEKGHFLSLFLGPCGDRPYLLGTWPAAALGDLGYQVGVQLLALVEGYAVQHPLSSHHRCFTHLPDHMEATVLWPGVRLHDHDWASTLAEGECRHVSGGV